MMRTFLVGILFFAGVILVLAAVAVLFPFMLFIGLLLEIMVAVGLVLLFFWLLGKIVIFCWRKLRTHA
jgi:hypothetical protein